MPREGRSPSACSQLDDCTVAPILYPLPRSLLLDADTQIIIKEDDCHAGADLQPS